MEEKTIKPTTKPVSMKYGRKIIQIAMSNNFSNHGYIGEIIALCNDGSLWQRAVQITDEQSKGGEWLRLNDIPQD